MFRPLKLLLSVELLSLFWRKPGRGRGGGGGGANKSEGKNGQTEILIPEVPHFFRFYSFHLLCAGVNLTVWSSKCYS